MKILTNVCIYSNQFQDSQTGLQNEFAFFNDSIYNLDQQPPNFIQNFLMEGWIRID